MGVKEKEERDHHSLPSGCDQVETRVFWVQTLGDEDDTDRFGRVFMDIV